MLMTSKSFMIPVVVQQRQKLTTLITLLASHFSQVQKANKLVVSRAAKFKQPGDDDIESNRFSFLCLNPSFRPLDDIDICISDVECGSCTKDCFLASSSDSSSSIFPSEHDTRFYSLAGLAELFHYSTDSSAWKSLETQILTIFPSVSIHDKYALEVFIINPNNFILSCDLDADLSEMKSVELTYLVCSLFLQNFSSCIIKEQLTA